MIEAGAVQRGLTTNRRVNRILNRLGKRARATEEWRLRKHVALLAYLAFEQRHSPSRDTLLALLWPDVPEADGPHRDQGVTPRPGVSVSIP